MKTKQTTKLFGVILSVLMLVSLMCGMTVTASAAEAGTAQIAGQSVNLGGDLSIKYLVEVGDGVSASDLKLVVTYHGMQTTLTESTLNDDGYYVFTFEGIAPQCMGDNVAAELFIGENETAADSKPTYSVADNLKNIYDSSDAKTQQLIIDTLEYGAAAQTYRDYKTGALVTDGFAAADSDTDVAVPENKPVLDDQSSAVSVSANVRYSTVNYLLFGLTGADSYDGKVTIDGNSVTGTMQGVYYAVATGAISPENFAQDFTMKYDNGDNDYITLAYSVNDYCYAAYTKGETQSMKDLALALYNYGLSAHIYIDKHTGGEATCQGQQCEICGTYYGEVDADNHFFNPATGKCSGCEAELAAASVTINGNTTYYETLAEAATAAQTDTEAAPATLKLEQSIDLGTSCLTTTTGVFTFDLNGKTLSSSKDRDGTLAIEGGIVTITDTVGGGTITNSTYYGVAAFYGCTVTINGGTISGEIHGVYIENATVTINGGIITGTDTEEGAGVYINTWVGYTSSVTINGGTITGAYCDLYDNMDSTIILGLGEDGVGATFPGGLSIENGVDSSTTLTLDTILGEDAAYWQGDKMIFLTEGQMEITGSDVTVKKECKHENATYSNITATQHTIDCSCGYNVAEDHSTELDENKATCQNKAKCDLCGTEYGDTLVHNYTYIADDETDTITESCDRGCGHSATISITAPTDAVYSGEEQGVTVTGDLVAEHTLTYNVEDVPVTAGTYTATLTVGDKSVSIIYTIAKADPEYTLPTGLTAYLGQTLANVTLPSGWAWVDSSASVGAEGANEFDAIFTPADTDNYNTATEKVTVTVSKASASVTTTPAAVSDLEYTGGELALVTAGAAEGGTVQYKLGEDGTYSETIPTASAVGEYTVYWKVVGDEIHNDTEEQSVTVAISAKAVTEDNVTVGNMETSYTYTGEAIAPAITITVGGKTLVEGTDYDVTYSNNTYVSPNAKVTITFKGNYSGTVEVYFTITAQEGTDDFTSDWMPVE